MEYLVWWIYVVAVLGGFAAGVINTLAGSGSVITLGILTELMGLPANLANGTNRVGILAQGIASSRIYFKFGQFSFRKLKSILLLTSIGSVFGVYVATVIPNDGFTFVYRYLMLVMLIVILVKPSRWIREEQLERNLPIWFSAPIYLILGFYGGFIQLGMGIFFLAAAVLLSGLNLRDGNIAKTIVVTFYTFIVLAIFQWKGLIAWSLGLTIAIGQAFGGVVAARFLNKNDYALKTAYALLVLMVLVIVLRQFSSIF